MPLVVRIAGWLPVLLLFAFVAHHLVRVRRDGLTPWKGGGFGMFSTTDTPWYRRVRIRATTADGNTIPVALAGEFDYDSSALFTCRGAPVCSSWRHDYCGWSGSSCRVRTVFPSRDSLTT
jgi:hypothetical protein